MVQDRKPAGIELRNRVVIDAFNVGVSNEERCSIRRSLRTLRGVCLRFGVQSIDS